MKIKVLFKRPGEAMQTMDTESTIRAMQSLVDGYVGAIPLSRPGLVLLCAECAPNTLERPLNMVMPELDSRVYGNLVIVKTSAWDGPLKGLSKGDLEWSKLYVDVRSV